MKVTTTREYVHSNGYGNDQNFVFAAKTENKKIVSFKINVDGKLTPTAMTLLANDLLAFAIRIESEEA